MTAKNRLNKVEKGLSPKQMVLRDIEESRRYRSLMEYSLAVADGRVGVKGSICERIEASLRSSSFGLSEQTKHHRVREAQREGLFLLNLWVRSNLGIGELLPELRLANGLIAAQFLLFLHCHDESVWTEERFEAMRSFFEEHRRRIRGLREAATFIQSEYFDGRSVLHPGTDADLADLLNGIEPFSSMWDLPSMPGGKPAEVAEEAKATKERGRIVAEGWIIQAKIKVHERMDEERLALSLARRLVNLSPP